MPQSRLNNDDVEKATTALLRSPEVQERYDRVIGRLAETLAPDFKGDTPLRITPLSTIRRPFSDLVRCRAQSGSQSLGLYMKFVRLSGQDKEEDRRMIYNLEKEVAVMRRLSKTFPSDAPLSVPKILAYFPDETVVITQENQGLPLLTRIAKSAKGFPGKRSLSGLERHCHAAGEWLSTFHKIAPFDLGRQEAPADLPAYVRLRLEKLWKSAAFRQRDVASILSYIQKQIAAASNEKPALRGTHGDFSLSNILAAAGQVTVLDFGMYHQASPYLDVSYFCQHLDDFLTHPLYLQSTTTALNDAFLAGYGRDFDPRHPLYRAYYVRHMVNHLIGLSRFVSLTPLKRLYQKQQYRHCLSTLRKWISKG